MEHNNNSVEAPSFSGSNISKEILEKLYWEEGLTLREIASRFQISLSRVHGLMRMYGITRRTRGTVRFGSKKRALKGADMTKVLNENSNKIIEYSRELEKKGFKCILLES